MNPIVLWSLTGIAIVLIIYLPYYLEADYKSLKKYEEDLKYKHMRKISIRVDEKLEMTMGVIMYKLGLSSEANLFRYGIALLKAVVEGRDKGLETVLINEDDEIIKEVILPNPKRRS